jgi:lysozyme
MIAMTDLCYSNTKVDYPAMKAAGVSLVYMRLAQAGLGLDSMFLTHRAGCVNVGVPFGSYFFYDYKHYTPAQNAQYCWEAIHAAGSPGVGIAPLALDMEYEPKLGWGEPPAATMLGYALNFYAELARLGSTVHINIARMLFYGNPSMFGPMAGLPGMDALIAHPLWVAHWLAPYPNIGKWKAWTLWQNHGEIKVAWASQPVDMGYFNGDPLALDAWLHPDTAPALPTRDACINDMLTKAGYKWQA